jgi:hypothetical protein
MRKSQADMILEALKVGDSITPMDALNRWSCFRLGARIFELRRKGYVIDNVGRDDANYACYKLRSIHPAPTMPPAFPAKSIEQANNQLLF